MPRKPNKKRFVNPFNRQYGWRTGIDTTAGKTIRKDADGFEEFRDYLSESEAETTSELSRLENASLLKENKPSRLHRPKLAVKGPSLSQPCSHSTAYSSMLSQASRGGALSQINGDTLGISSIINSQASDTNPVGWLRNKNIGRRTGKDLTEGKIIRVDEEGYEIFEDFLSESEAESLSSSLMTNRLSRTSTNFTREPSKLIEDHSIYDTNMSASAEASNSEAQVSRDQMTGTISSLIESTREEVDTPTNTQTRSMAANNESFESEEEDEEVSLRADNSSYTAASQGETGESATKTQLQSQDRSGSITSTRSHMLQSQARSSSITSTRSHTLQSQDRSGSITSTQRQTLQSHSKNRSGSISSIQRHVLHSHENISEGEPTPKSNMQSMVRSIVEIPTENRIEAPTTVQEITKASHMDIGGNKTGSITKSEDLTNSVVPSFRTRKRISFSAAESDGSRKSSIALGEKQNDTKIKIPSDVTEVVLDSDADSIEIVTLDDGKAQQKPNARKSVQRKSTSTVQKSIPSELDDEQTEVKSQGQRKPGLLETKISALTGRRNKRGKSLPSSIPAETPQVDSHKTQLSGKRRGKSLSENSSLEQKKSTSAISQLSKDNQEEDHLQNPNDDDDETASNASQEFLFFRNKKTRENQTVTNKTQDIKSQSQTSHRKKTSALLNAMNVDGAASDISEDRSIDPNTEIEQWKRGKPKVGGKRKKKSEPSERKERNVEETEESTVHSPAKKRKGQKAAKEKSSVSRKTSRGRKPSDDSRKSLEPRIRRSNRNSDAQLSDTNDKEAYNDIEESELVVEKEVRLSPQATSKRKSSVTIDSVEIKSTTKSRGSLSDTAENSFKGSRNTDISEEEEGIILQVNYYHEEDIDTHVNEKSSKMNKSRRHSVSMSDSPGQMAKSKEQSMTTKKSRKSSSDKSHVSEVKEDEQNEVIDPEENMAAHTSQFIKSFLTEDHEKQGLDTNNMSSRSKSSGYKTRKAKTRNDSIQRKINSVKKLNKFQTRTSEGMSSRKDKSSLIGARDPEDRKSMRKSRSLHSAFIGSLENLQGIQREVEMLEVEDADPNDLYVEKERSSTKKGKGKGQRKSMQQGGTDQKRTKRSQKRKSGKRGKADSVTEEEDVEGIQGRNNVDDGPGPSEAVANESESFSDMNNRKQRKTKSLGSVGLEPTRKKKGSQRKTTKSKSLGGQAVDVIDEEVEENKVMNENVDELKDENLDDIVANDAVEHSPKDEGNQDNVSKKQSLGSTPVSVYQVDEELLKSGVSFRHRNQTSVKEESINQMSSNKTPVTLRKHMDFMNSPAPGLTPILKQPGSVIRGKKRRVTINHLVEEQTFNSPDTSGEKQSLSMNSVYSMNATPIHIFQTTTSESPVPQVLMPPKPKIFLPEDAPDGVRRSRRVRCQPVAWYKGERLVYERRKSGLGIVKVEPSHVEMLMLAQEAKRRKNVIKKRNQNRTENKRTKFTQSPRRNLSVHTDLDPELQDSSDSEVLVLNPANNEEVLMECFSSKDSEVFVGPSKHDPISTDPYVMSLRLNQRQFMMGNLYLRPLKSKPEQIVNSGTMVFCLLKGKICVTIHRTKMVAEAGDMFFVPQGNTYSIENLRKEEARLTFSCYKFSNEDLSTME
ncbi:ankyrin repeat domain-containing protein 36A-like [Saccostrea echinata]|uniref:ankyrin repeat domain-containing protein 36A-like n=1 Tax=Saccostrea echinata TaxID=191078 RepID=UPI002A82CFEB|nr:ankyrin repeat domain-containing protein 36A-like [Saccostrea echinata]